MSRSRCARASSPERAGRARSSAWAEASWSPRAHGSRCCDRPPDRAAMTAVSAGLLLFRTAASDLEVLLVHPGGPFWQRRDLGAWSIPKGEIGAEEDALAAARREFREETGWSADGAALALGSVRQKGGKV